MNVQQAYDFFDLLPTCEDQEIEDRFRVLAKKHHPDMHRNSSPEVQAENEQLFRKLIQAEEIILKDRATAEQRRWEKTLHQRAPQPKKPQRKPKCPYSEENPDILAGQLKEHLRKQRVVRLQNVIDSDFRAMVRNFFFALVCVLPGYFLGWWVLYVPAAYCAFACFLIFLDWNDARGRLEEERAASV